MMRVTKPEETDEMMQTFKVLLRSSVKLVRLRNGLEKFLNDDTIIDANITAKNLE